MALVNITGLSPVTFISEDSSTAGTEYQIPLASLQLDTTTGKIDLSKWPPPKNKNMKLGAADTALLKVLLPDLLKRGVLSVSSP